MRNSDSHGLSGIIIDSIRGFKMFNFMCSLLILLILLGMFEDYKKIRLIINGLSVLVIITGAYAASDSKKSVVILLFLALPWLVTSWLFVTSAKTFFFSSFFFLYVIILLLEMIVRSRDITPNTLYAAVCIYLLLGILWASIYALINEIAPGSIFSNNVNNDNLTVVQLIYFSYTTLTTLGYGDITSITPLVRIISVLEAIIGQLFIAFVVARLVAVYVSNSIKSHH